MFAYNKKLGLLTWICQGPPYRGLQQFKFVKDADKKVIAPNIPTASVESVKESWKRAGGLAIYGELVFVEERN